LSLGYTLPKWWGVSGLDYPYTAAPCEQEATAMRSKNHFIQSILFYYFF
jgi:hypothetical protein